MSKFSKIWMAENKKIAFAIKLTKNPIMYQNCQGVSKKLISVKYIQVKTKRSKN